MEDLGDLAPNAPKHGTWSGWRNHFPAVGKSVYLDTATSGPVSIEAAGAARKYYEWALDGGVRHHSLWHSEVQNCRVDVSEFIGSSIDEIGFTPNTSTAINCAALLFEGTGSVLVGEREHPAVITPWLARGYRVDRATAGKDGQLTVESYAKAIRPDTRVICASHVRFNDGQVTNLRSLADLAKAHSAYLVVDGIQSAGILDLKVDIGIDVLGFGSFKWLNSGYGGGVLYVKRGLIERHGLPIAGNRSRSSEDLHEVISFDPLKSAAAFELGSVCVPAALALGASLKLIKTIGQNRIRHRVLELTNKLRQGLSAMGYRTTTDFAAQELTPIISVVSEDGSHALETLEKAGINAAIREENIRLAISWYNNESDIDHCLNVFDALVRARG